MIYSILSSKVMGQQLPSLTIYITILSAYYVPASEQKHFTFFFFLAIAMPQLLILLMVQWSR